ncbi:MAG TPA: TauD/TfdA family dioxygenase [Stellaceae bacterium]|nr:TauD/TfdA family dioxygenase [Stellaceae bacterium]
MDATLAVKVTPLSPACGAMIEGVDLAEDLPDATIAAIKGAWAKHLVLVFRGQNITQEQQLRFAAHFGELGERKTAQARDDIRSRAEGVLQDDNRVMLVSNMKVDGKPVGAFGDGEMWFHIDSGYTARPYKYTFLYAVELPSTGGNTRFANMYKAYEAVPPALKAKLAGRKALHIHEYKRTAKVDVPDDLSSSLHYFHPVFTTHPETGRKTLFVDRLMTARIAGMSAAESDAILEELYAIGEDPANIYEHRWRLGDVVMWDNRCTIHARTWFPPEENRLLRRCTVAGGPLSE